MEMGECPSALPALVPFHEVEESYSKRLTKILFDMLEKNPDRSWTPDVLRPFVRMSIPKATLADIKDALIMMETEYLIEEERDKQGKRLKRFRSFTTAGVPAKAAVDAGLISFDFVAHEAARAAKRAEAEQAQAAITQRRAETNSEVRGQYEEASAEARRLEEMRDNARLALVGGEKSAISESLAADPKPDTMGGDPEILKLSLDERRAITVAWASRHNARVAAALAPLKVELARLEAEASAARLRSDALAARLAELA